MGENTGVLAQKGHAFSAKGEQKGFPPSFQTEVSLNNLCDNGKKKVEAVSGVILG